MSYTTGDSIRSEIREELIRRNIPSNLKNIEFIFYKHMADPADRPISSLVDTWHYKLN